MKNLCYSEGNNHSTNEKSSKVKKHHQTWASDFLVVSLEFEGALFGSLDER